MHTHASYSSFFSSLITLFSLATTGVLGLNLEVYLQPNDVANGGYDTYNSTSPYICTRPCGSERRLCYYKFHLENYAAMGDACGDCPRVKSDCSNPQCVPGDGFERGIQTVNRMIPGPSIQVCRGDKVVVDVINEFPAASTTIHWHGIHQRGTPYMDGVPMISQCPILPAQTFRYYFNVDVAGTYFWHSHSGVQKINGVFGPLIVRQPKSAEPSGALYEQDLPSHVISVLDYMHTDAEQKIPGLRAAGIDGQFPDTYLINGRGIYSRNNSELSQILASGNHVPLSEFRVRQGQRYRFRLISSTGTNCPFVFSIQSHRLSIIASDGSGDVQPASVDNIGLTSGERYDFILTANRTVGRYYIYVRGKVDCEGINQVAVLRYEGSSNTNPPLVFGQQTGLTLNSPNSYCNATSSNTLCYHQLRSSTPVPWEITSGPGRLLITLSYGYHFFESDFFRRNEYQKFLRVREGPSLEMLTNNISFTFPPSPLTSQFYDIPRDMFCDTCSQPTEENPCNCLLLYTIPLGTVVDVIVYVTREWDPEELPHPFHLHGYDYYVLEEGVFPQGFAKGLPQVINRLRSGLINPRSPPRKDTLPMSGGGYIVLRFKADNPGFWFNHCHIAYHSDFGMDAVFQVGRLNEHPPIPDDFPKCGNFKPPLPSSFLNN